MKIAINGFGRIGRMALRVLIDEYEHEDMEFYINDLTSPEMLAYLLKYDTAQGVFKHNVYATVNEIVVDTHTIPVYCEADASKLPWKELGIDLVLECSGFYATKEKAMAHIAAGAKKVIISSPAKGDLKTIVYGVNHTSLTPDDVIISAASCTTNCLAPMVDLLMNCGEIKNGIMTTVHAYTGDQMILDGPQRKGNLRRSRAGAENIVPSTTGAAEAIGLVIPQMTGKLTGSAQRVPVATGSTCILVANIHTGNILNKDIVNNALDFYTDWISVGITDDPIVSSDVIGMSYGCLIDQTQTLVQNLGNGNHTVQIVGWYDNEMSYTHQMIRTAMYAVELK